MALSDCSKCWDTPCVCGYAYRNWSQERRDELAKVILNPPFPPDTKVSSPITTPIILSKGLYFKDELSQPHSIEEMILEGTVSYKRGYRFLDEDGVAWRPDGSYKTIDGREEGDTQELTLITEEEYKKMTTSESSNAPLPASWFKQ